MLFLYQGDWNGQQIISQRWVTASTTPDAADQRPFKDNLAWRQAGGYHKYHWWGLHNPDETYDYLAWGKQNQIIYVSPPTNTVVVRLGGVASPMRGRSQSRPWPTPLREQATITTI